MGFHLVLATSQKLANSNFKPPTFWEKGLY